MSSGEIQQKKRLRVPISCELCRRKKIKCDKKRPSCSNCVKTGSVCVYQEMKFNGSAHQLNNILNLGSYNASAPKAIPDSNIITTNDQKRPPPPTSLFDMSISAPQNTQRRKAREIQWANEAASESQMKDELSQLRDKIKALESKLSSNSSPSRNTHSVDVKADQVINFYDGYSALQINESRVLNHGPLSWITLVKKDIHVKSIWTKVLSTNRSSLILHSTAKTVEEDVRDADDMAPTELETENKEKRYSRKSIGNTTMYRPDTEFGTIQLVLRILPEKRHIWALIDRFFEAVYPFMPFLDYDNFMKQVAKIIGGRSSENVKLTQLGISKRLDFALVGILLLILRFAFLSLQSNCDSHVKYAKPEVRDLLDLNISVDFPNTAQYCLNQFRLLRSSNLEILQCSLYMRLYHRYSPEDGDGADADSQIYNGMLFQMAISIGLNRDPEELLNSSASIKLCQLRRKIWFALIQLETYHSLVLGSPSYTAVQSSNIKQPDLNLDEYNSPSTDIEKFVIYWISKFSSRFPVMTRVSQLVLNLKGDTKIADIISSIDDLEDIALKSYGSFASILRSPASVLTEAIFKVRSMQSYLEISTAVFCVCFHLFLKYDVEQDSKNGLHYFKKILAISTELICGFTQIANKLPKYFGYGFDFYLTHSLLITMHRIIQVQFSLFSRLSHYGLLLQITAGYDDSRMNIVNQIKESIMVTLADYLKELKKLTPKYYYAWKMFKAQNAIFQLLSAEPLYKVESNRIVPNQDHNLVGDIPQYSILSSLNNFDLRNIYVESKSKHDTSPSNTLEVSRSSHQGTSPAALSHILNSTPTNSTSSVSLSPDNANRDLLNSSTSKEVDDIWLDLLNKKKVNDIDESITYGLQFTKEQMLAQVADPEQQRQLQQPDFSSLLEMNAAFPKSTLVTSSTRDNPQNYDTQNMATASTMDHVLFDYAIPTRKVTSSPAQHREVPGHSQGASQQFHQRVLPANVTRDVTSAARERTQQQTQSVQESAAQAQFEYNSLNLNGLLEDPLNFNQLFGTTEYPFNDFL